MGWGGAQAHKSMYVCKEANIRIRFMCVGSSVSPPVASWWCKSRIINRLEPFVSDPFHVLCYFDRVSISFSAEIMADECFVGYAKSCSVLFIGDFSEASLLVEFSDGNLNRRSGFLLQTWPRSVMHAALQTNKQDVTKSQLLPLKCWSKQPIFQVHLDQLGQGRPGAVGRGRGGQGPSLLLLFSRVTR